MLRFPAQDAPQGAVVPYDQVGRVLRPGEIVAFRVTNPAPAEVDVTLLFISSTYGIKTLFPPTAEYTNRLGPGQSIDTLRFRVRPPAGTDHVVAIAVRTQTSTSSLDFSYLEQPDLPQARRDSRGARPGTLPREAAGARHVRRWPHAWYQQHRFARLCRAPAELAHGRAAVGEWVMDRTVNSTEAWVRTLIPRHEEAHTCDRGTVESSS